MTHPGVAAPYPGGVAEEAGPSSGGYQGAVELLGGWRVLHRVLLGPLDAHELISDGLPAEALSFLIENLSVLRDDASIEKATGMSVRTYQRRKEASAKPLNAEQSGRTWKFAEILARATAILGSQQDAEHWFEQPAIGLDQRRPIDLLTTPAGVRLVEDFLQRVEYGVYT
ncbi:antitoxin Xre/MbcA/ParS toxin-binding domain-containing protein [Phenylobacterium sp.]|uniref:type II RES/Xre toxin-antitoxin system antitoxin n=1 Tax=Phenylobacterium sp. TaxID=1871053 RepID=UPI00286CBBBB|nr:antitoxin Xre/MbcA/ParS toxin-binding domain-containing protein [Phenylobacterium sp.]